MAIPYNDGISWKSFCQYKNLLTPQEAASTNCKTSWERAKRELAQTFPQLGVRGVQFIRDGLRLTLKVPIRAIWKPIILSKNWGELERAKINVKLTGYSFVQLISVPVKFAVALIAIATSAISQEKANWLLDKSEAWTAHLDGRASQLEALKEEGAKNAVSRELYTQYRIWLYNIDPKLCRL